MSFKFLWMNKSQIIVIEVTLFSIYNSIEDVQNLVKSIHKIKNVLRN